MTANIRTSQRTVSAMQRFAVSQKNRTEAITISPFLLSLPYRTENRRFSALSCTKTGGTQPKLSAACFVVQSCLADADFVVFSNYCLIGTRRQALLFIAYCYVSSEVRFGCFTGGQGSSAPAGAGDGLPRRSASRNDSVGAGFYPARNIV